MPTDTQTLPCRDRSRGGVSSLDSAKGNPKIDPLAPLRINLRRDPRAINLRFLNSPKNHRPNLFSAESRSLSQALPTVQPTFPVLRINSPCYRTPTTSSLTRITPHPPFSTPQIPQCGSRSPRLPQSHHTHPKLPGLANRTLNLTSGVTMPAKPIGLSRRTIPTLCQEGWMVTFQRSQDDARQRVEDIDARQEEVLAELERLNARIESLLQTHGRSTASETESSVGVSSVQVT